MRSAIVIRLPVDQVIENLLGMPRTTGLIGPASLDAVMANGELFIGRIVTVALLTGSHGVITGPVEYRSHSVLGQIGWYHLRIAGVWVSAWKVPDCTSGHDHVT